MFEREIEYYEAKKDELLLHHKNQFVVIKDDRLIGAYTTDQEAYEAGLNELGNIPFLIKHVTSEEEIVRFPALALAISLGIADANT